ncbi:MAG: FTR1 family iron permease [Rhodocyclales bacterium GWA2_65_20]|nr:MAG: FTR1 family iron permease [Rhodocyclales bacterium GWA2_65_20]
MWNALIVVWRESLEAMLVIGILLSWIGRQPEPAGLRRGLWAGVAAGVAFAAALAFATWRAQDEFQAATLERVQLAMVLAAAALILHMVLWMHAHGRRMKHELERQAQRTLGAGDGARAALGLAAIAALAVAREGAETVIFLYGLGMEGAITELAGGAGAGFALAAATAWLVARGARFLSLRTLFRASEILLLLIATSLLAAGVDRLIGLEWLPPLADPLWDTAAWLPDARGSGRFLADFAGYRARPAATLVLAIAAFWSYALWRMAQIDRAAARHD